MAKATARIKDITIPSGTAVSQWLKAREVSGDGDVIMLYGENNTDGVITYTLEVTPDADAASPLVNTYTIPDDSDSAAVADAVPPAQGKARAYKGLGSAGAFRIKASANVTADRRWNVTKQWQG